MPPKLKKVSTNRMEEQTALFSIRLDFLLRISQKRILTNKCIVLQSVVLMVANIGSTSMEQNSIEEEPFLDKEKYAMRILIEKKVILFDLIH